MGRVEFIDFFLSNNLIYFLCLIFVGIIYFIIIMRSNRPLIDPLTIALISSALADVIPVYIFFSSKIRCELFVYVLIFEICFLYGLLFFKKKWNNPVSYREIKIYSTNKLFFIACFTIFLLLSFLKFYLLGIPLFLEESRLSLFQGSGGLGIIARINPFLKIYCILYCYFKILKKKYIYSFFLVLIILCDTLDGSKSFIINYILCFFLIYPVKIKQRTYILLGCLFLFCFIGIQLINLDFDLNSTLIASGLRFVSNGDVFYNILPYDEYKNYIVANPISYLFNFIFAPFKITSYPSNIGFIIGENLNGYEAMGPNIRPSIFGLLFFGQIGGIVFGFIYGLSLSFIIYLLNKKSRSKNLVKLAFNFYLFILVCSGITGFLDLLGGVFDIVITTVIIAIFSTIFRPYKKNENSSILSSSIS